MDDSLRKMVFHCDTLERYLQCLCHPGNPLLLSFHFRDGEKHEKTVNSIPLLLEKSSSNRRINASTHCHADFYFFVVAHGVVFFVDTLFVFCASKERKK